MRDWREPPLYPYPRPRPDYYPDVKFKSNNSAYFSCNPPLISSCIADYRDGGVVSDEGITVKGAKTTQVYRYGDIDELEHRTYTIILRLKLRCPTCGRKSKSSSTFCYNCGTYLR
jgi:hypothetical protein